MKHPLLKITLPILIVVLLVTAGAKPAAAQNYSDGFETPSINPFWTVRQDNGSVTPSTDQHYSGSQSAKFSSTNGGQREMHLTHVFPSPTKGNFSIYFYDAAPGQETLYEKLNLYNSSTTNLAAIGTQDFDANCYTAQLYNYNTGVQQGPNAQCGIYPQTSTTNVSRTAGWHKLEISAAASSISLSIDGTQVFSTAGDFSFDTIDVAVSGPYWRPDTVAYFDDFNFAPLDDCAQQLQTLLNQVNALTQQNSQLQSQVAQLQAQLGAANQTIQNQQTQINQLQGAINNTLGGIQTNFRTEFNDPQFTIPGLTPLDRLQNLMNAIFNLNHGRKQGLYANLGGQH